MLNIVLDLVLYGCTFSRIGWKENKVGCKRHEARWCGAFISGLMAFEPVSYLIFSHRNVEFHIFTVAVWWDLLSGGFYCLVGFAVWWVLLSGGFCCLVGFTVWWVLLSGGFTVWSILLSVREPPAAVGADGTRQRLRSNV